MSSADLLGYKYSLLSTVATAGQNLVVTMIPARDMEEFKLLPQADLDFITKWVNWVRQNKSNHSYFSSSDITNNGVVDRRTRTWHTSRTRCRSRL